MGRSAVFDQERFDRLNRAGRYAGAERMIRRAMIESGGSDSHWLLAQLAWYCTRDGRLAESGRHLARAHALAPRCPLVRLERAQLAQARGLWDQAIRGYRSLIACPVERLAFGPCGEGLRHAQSMRLDCCFHIGECYEDSGRPAIARRWYTRHLSKRRAGLPSVYERTTVVRALRGVGGGGA
ncbi:MAG: tetratricopeptide repeat protein [Phycisphaerales bacterium]